MRPKMGITDLLSSSSTKAKLTEILAESLMQHFDSINILVVYGTIIKSHEVQYEHSHEEADTMIPNQVLDALSNEVKQIC